MNYILWPYIRVGDPDNANHIWKDTDYASVVADMKNWLTTRLALLETMYAPKRVVGDADGDGEVTSGDAVAILRYIAAYEVESFGIDVADFDGDGEVTSGDAVAILRYLAGY